MLRFVIVALPGLYTIQMSCKLRVITQHLLRPSGSKAATPTLATKCKRKEEKIQITFFPDQGSNPVRRIQSPALYHVAIKAGFYRKAVEVYLISKLLHFLLLLLLLLVLLLLLLLLFWLLLLLLLLCCRSYVHFLCIQVNFTF